VDKTAADEGEATDLTPLTLFADHLELALSKRQAAQDWPYHNIVNRGFFNLYALCVLHSKETPVGGSGGIL
jgi:hypothetical protein